MKQVVRAPTEMLLPLLIFLAIGLHYGLAKPDVQEREDIIEQYISVSMELVEAMDGTGADPGELHEMAKGIVYHGRNQKEIFKLYDSYLEDKNDTIKEAFTKYTNEKRLEYVKKRMHTVLGYYLTKDQIKRMESVLEKEAPEAKSTEDLIAAVEKELAKDIGEKKAKKSVEMAIKELRLLGKRHVGWLEKASKLFFSLIEHDEH